LNFTGHLDGRPSSELSVHTPQRRLVFGRSLYLRTQRPYGFLNLAQRAELQPVGDVRVALFGRIDLDKHTQDLAANDRRYREAGFHRHRHR
jgi:hypothetical protein